MVPSPPSPPFGLYKYKGRIYRTFMMALVGLSSTIDILLKKDLDLTSPEHRKRLPYIT